MTPRKGQVWSRVFFDLDLALVIGDPTRDLHGEGWYHPVVLLGTGDVVTLWEGVAWEATPTVLRRVA